MMRKFFVEVCVHTPETVVINRQDAQNWPDSVQAAREMVLAMFHDDPMADRLFHNGIYSYVGVNDFGDRVVIRPVCEADGEDMQVVPCALKEKCTDLKVYPKCREH